MEFRNREKYEKIFSKNPGSPVLVRIAADALENNNTTRAIEILEGAVNEYPDYPAIYILLGRAYTKSGNFKSALQNFKKGSELLNSEQTYKYYLREIENAKRHTEEKEVSPSSLNSMDLSDLLGASTTTQTTHPESADIDDNLISETLAKIYLTQGQKNEAMRVYEKLIKKYPLKKIYYETRIKEISSE
jgi:predicted Zn-dependent protease